MEYIIEIYEGGPVESHYAGYVFVTAKSIDEAWETARQIEAKPNVAFVNVEPYQSTSTYD